MRQPTASIALDLPPIARLPAGDHADTGSPPNLHVHAPESGPAEDVKVEMTFVRELMDGATAS